MELSKSKKNDFYINMISRVVAALKDNEDPLISSCYKDLQERNIDMESLLVAAFYIESERNISRSLNDKQEELYLYLEQGVHNCLHNIVCSGILTNKKSARSISISIRNLLHLLTKRFKREMINVALITDTLVENEEDYGMICRNNYAWLVDEAMELVKNNPDPIIVNRLNALNKRLGDIGKYQLEVFIANANKDKSKVNYSREDLSPSLLASLTASWLEFGVDDPEVTNKIPTDELEIECRLWSIFTEKTFFIYIDEANRKNGEKK